SSSSTSSPMSRGQAGVLLDLTVVLFDPALLFAFIPGMCFRIVTLFLVSIDGGTRGILGWWPRESSQLGVDLQTIVVAMSKTAPNGLSASLSNISHSSHHTLI